MASDNRPLMIVGLIILAILFFQYGDFFGIVMQAPIVQYNNQDIEARFILTDYTNPTIQAFFNDEELFEIEANETNETIIFTKDITNGTYIFKLKGLEEEGIFKVIVSEGNITEAVTIEIRDPFVDVKHNIPSTVLQDETLNMQIKAYTPQGDEIEADAIEIDVSDPDNKINTIFLDKSGNIFTTNFNYEKAGNYIFKIHARKDGFRTQEATVITSVIKETGIHPVVWIWTAAIVIWLLLFGIKILRRIK